MAEKTSPIASVLSARSLPGVELAMPLILSGGCIKLPNARAEPLQIVGTVATHYLGGPWNLVQGSLDVLAQGDTIIVEDS